MELNTFKSWHAMKQLFLNFEYNLEQFQHYSSIWEQLG